MDLSLSRDRFWFNIGKDSVQNGIICDHGSKGNHPEGLEDRLDPWAGLVFPKHTQRLSKTELSHYVKRREVI